MLQLNACNVLQSSHTLPEADSTADGGSPLDQMWRALAVLGKGQMGLALMGSLQSSYFLADGLFGYSR